MLIWVTSDVSLVYLDGPQGEFTFPFYFSIILKNNKTVTGSYITPFMSWSSMNNCTMLCVQAGERKGCGKEEQAFQSGRRLRQAQVGVGLAGLGGLK